MFFVVRSNDSFNFPLGLIKCIVIVVIVPHKKNVFFHIHEIARVVLLYTSLRLVEGDYRPQRDCVGWASVTESCLEACMWIKRTCLDKFPPGHPKMFQRTLDIISLFVLAISNTVNLFLFLFVCLFWCCSHENVSKWKLFHTDCPLKNKKQKRWFFFLYVTCTQNWEVPVSYQWCHTETRERARENSVSNAVWRSPLLKSL